MHAKKQSSCVDRDLSTHVNLRIIKIGQGEVYKSLPVDRAADDCKFGPGFAQHFRMNEDMPRTRDFSLFVSTPIGNQSPSTTPLGVNPHTFALTRIYRIGAFWVPS